MCPELYVKQGPDSGNCWISGTCVAFEVDLFLSLCDNAVIVRMPEERLELEAVAQAKRLGALHGMGLADRGSPE
jgi:hypothetical protein